MKRVLVTGGARRIGSTIARALAADGWHVVVHYNRSGDAAADVAAGIVAAGGRCETMQADLSDREAVAGLVPRCVAQVGGLEALVNNASSFRYDSLASMDAASWDAHMGPNLEAPVFLAQAFARACAGRPGCVINMLDHKVVAPNPDFFSYTIAKIAHAGATRLLAQALQIQALQIQALQTRALQIQGLQVRGLQVGALQQDGGQIRVNGLAPGITLLSGKQTQAGFERAWSAPPLGRSSTPGELADACRYILATGSLNGQIIVLDGGDSLLGRQRDVAFET